MVASCFGNCFKGGVKELGSYLKVDTKQLLVPPQTFSNKGVEIDTQILSAVPSYEINKRWKGYLPWTFWTRDTQFRRGKVIPRTVGVCRFKRGILATYERCVLEAVDDRHLAVYRMAKNAPRVSFEDVKASEANQQCGDTQPSTRSVNLEAMKGALLHSVKMLAARVQVEGVGQLNINERHGPIWHFKFSGEDELLEWLATLQSMPGLYRRPEDFYEVLEELGQGATARVCKCRSKTNGKLYVMKYRADKYNNFSSRLMQNELKILQICAKNPHPSFPVLEDFFFESNGDIQIVQEYLFGGELFKQIAKLKHFSELKARDITRQILEGVQHLHSMDIAHRDLKPANLIFESKDPNARLKILDFDLARINYSPTWEASTPCGTTQFMAPEVVGAAKYDKSVDMWSLGVIVFMMIAGHGPFKGRNDNVTEDNIRKHRYNFRADVWQGVSAFCKDFINELLSMNPADRPTAEQALQHPWFTLMDSEVPNEAIHVHSNLRRAASLDGTETLDLRHRTRALPEVLQVDLRPFDLHLATQVGLNAKAAGITTAQALFPHSLKHVSCGHSHPADLPDLTRVHSNLLKSRQDAKRQKQIAQLRQSLLMSQGGGLTSRVNPDVGFALSPAASADHNLTTRVSDITTKVQMEQTALEASHVQGGTANGSIGRNSDGYKVIVEQKPATEHGRTLREIVVSVHATDNSRVGSTIAEHRGPEHVGPSDDSANAEGGGGAPRPVTQSVLLSRKFRNEQQASSLRRNIWSSPNFMQDAVQQSLPSVGKQRDVERLVALRQLERVGSLGIHT